MSGIDLFTPEHEELRTNVRSFVERELLVHAEEWERAESFPKEVFARVGQLGYFGLKSPKKLGDRVPTSWPTLW